MKMTPKEKAVELVNLYKSTLMLFDEDIDSKKCAIIVVNEILKNIPKDGYFIAESWVTPKTYWEQVKQEIINL
jgi:hypothetical protein